MYSSEKQVYDSSYFLNRTHEVVKGIAQTLIKPENECWIPRLETEFKTKTIDPDYDDEEIIYLTKEGLMGCQLFLVKSLLYKDDGSLYSSSHELNARRGEGEMIVMDECGNIFTHVKDRGRIHHSSFFSAQPVAFAGLFSVEKGIVKDIITYSGHYEPGERELANWRSLSTSFVLYSSFVMDFLTDRLRHYRCLINPKGVWKGCPNCIQCISATKLPCNHVICAKCYPTNQLNRCPECTLNVQSYVSVQVGNDQILLSSRTKCGDLSKQLIDKYGILSPTERPKFFALNQIANDGLTLDYIRNLADKDETIPITLINAPFGLVRGTTDLPDRTLCNVLSFICEGAGGRSYKWIEIQKAMKIIFPHFELPQLPRLAKYLISEGYAIPQPI